MAAALTLPLPPASLRPPSADSHGTGAAMSVLAHALLVAALAFGVQWHTNEPDGVEAELWSATPEFAAPRPTEPPPEPEPEPEPVRRAAPPPPPVRTAPPPPPPPPVTQPRAERDAEIATERAEKLKREKERQEAEDQRARERRQQAERDKKAEAEKDKREKEKADQLAEKKAQDKAQKAQQQAEAQRKAELDAKRKAEQDTKQAQAANADKLSAQQNAQREKMRQDQIRRMQAQLGGTGAPNSPGTAARTSGPSSSYGGRVRAYIKAQNKGLLTSDVPGNPTAEVEVTLAIDGTIKSTRLLKSSGSPAWDELAVRAVERTGTLPLDVGGTTPTTMVISLKPNE